MDALSARGGQYLRGVKRHSTFEDNVTVYSGASILGGETVIGEGVVIGSNVFITNLCRYGGFSHTTAMCGLRVCFQLLFRMLDVFSVA